MTKSRRNNRFSNRKNLRSKCRKHNIQRGGEVKCVKALYTINPRKGENASINKDDIIVETATNGIYTKGINITKDCEKVIYPTGWVKEYVPTDTEIIDIDRCKLSNNYQPPLDIQQNKKLREAAKKEAMDQCVKVCRKKDEENCKTYMYETFTFENFPEKTDELSEAFLSQCVKRSNSASNSRSNSASNSSSNSSHGKLPISTGNCGTKGFLGGRSNCVVLSSISPHNKNKVALYVNPSNTIEVRYFEENNTRYIDKKDLTLTTYLQIINDVKTYLGFEGPIMADLRSYIFQNKAIIYKGVDMLSRFDSIIEQLLDNSKII
jgi:hypothetical protein